jgi:prepilin peptidase CpaA
MTWKPFFPDVFAAGTFFFLLVGILAVAAYVDWKTYRIPKWLTVPLFALGLLVNLGRGAWMGAIDKPLWVLETGSALRGAADGLLFALAGAALAFALYTGMWMVGVVKGGDVKLCTAIGAWIGAFNLILFLFASAVVLFLLSIVWVMTGGLSAESRAVREKALRANPDIRSEREIIKLTRRGMSFSLCAAIATALVMMWAFRYDLQLMPPKPALQNGSAHASGHVALR